MGRAARGPEASRAGRGRLWHAARLPPPPRPAPRLPALDLLTRLWPAGLCSSPQCQGMPIWGAWHRPHRCLEAHPLETSQSCVFSSLGSQLKCLLLTEAFPDRAVESTQVLRQTHPILLAAGAYHTYHLLFMPRTPGGKLLRAGPSVVAFPAGSGSVPGAISNSVQTRLLCLTRGRSEQPATLGQHKHATPSHGHAGPAPPVASAVHLSSSSWAGSEISHPSELVTLYLAPVAPAVPARLTQPRAPVALRASCLSTALPVTVARGFLCPALHHPPPVRLIPELGIGVPPRAAAPWTHRPSLRTAYFEIFSDTGCREECEEAPCALCPAPQW